MTIVKYAWMLALCMLFAPVPSVAQPTFVDVTAEELEQIAKSDLVTHTRRVYFAKPGYRFARLDPTALLNDDIVDVVLAKDMTLRLERLKMEVSASKVFWQGKIHLHKQLDIRNLDGTELSEESKRETIDRWSQVSFHLISWDRNKTTGDLVGATRRPKSTGQGLPSSPPPIVRYLQEHELNVAMSMTGSIQDPVSGRTFRVFEIEHDGEILQFIFERDQLRSSFIRMESGRLNHPETDVQRAERGKYERVIAEAKQEARRLQRENEDETTQ